MPADHRDDERLSELLDHDGADAHVASCAACSARLESLRAAASLIGAPVATLPADRASQLVGTAVAARVAPFPARSGRAPGQWVAAVAAVALLVVGIPLLLRTTGASQSDEVGTAVSSGGGDFRSFDATEAAGDATGAGTGAGGDDAAMADTESAARLSEKSDAATPAPRAAATGGAGAAPLAYIGAYNDSGELVTALRATMSTGTPPDDGDEDGAEADGGKSRDRTLQCEDGARRIGAGRLGSLAYAAVLDWKGAQAEVLVFVLTEPSEGFTRQAYVMAPARCAVLADPRF